MSSKPANSVLLDNLSTVATIFRFYENQHLKRDLVNAKALPRQVKELHQTMKSGIYDIEHIGLCAICDYALSWSEYNWCIECNILVCKECMEKFDSGDYFDEFVQHDFLCRACENPDQPKPYQTANEVLSQTFSHDDIICHEKTAFSALEALFKSAESELLDNLSAVATVFRYQENVKLKHDLMMLKDANLPLLRQIKELHLKMNKGIKEFRYNIMTCDICNDVKDFHVPQNRNMSSWWCTDCNTYFCEECSEKYIEIPDTDNELLAPRPQCLACANPGKSKPYQTADEVFAQID